ncbi:MAG: xanthine dehydrogenase family protein, partial [Candidatus Eisenbacteria bacterium]|nr:xanthine dehydrogenase family protein [Candidatus Eisenbacteria bacterium]
MESPMRAQGSEIVGSSPARVDAGDKVSGRALFVDDIETPGGWFGGTVRSEAPRGKIRAISLDPAFDWSCAVVVTAGDLPGPNVVSMIKDDHRILAAGDVRFVGEPVALAAAPDRETLAAALRAIHVEIDPLPPVLTMEEALRGDRIIWGDDNVIAEYGIRDGNPAERMREADLVIEGVYRTGHQEHLYIEPNGMIAMPRPDGGVETIGSLQCPYYVHNALAMALGIAPESLIVRQAATGGAFGGKEDFPSVLALHASLLALRAGRPVRMIYERSEDIRCTTKRHPSLIRHRTGVRRDGTIAAAEIDIVLDGGAYATLSPVVLSRSILHAAGAYRIADISIRGRAVATNTPPNGAFRGFGAPQSLFAIERQIDRIAARLG